MTYADITSFILSLTFTDVLTLIVMPCIGLATLMTLVRLVRGPTLVDRVIALDLLNTFGIGVLAVQSMITGRAVYLDIGLVLGLVAFLATIAFAYYIQRGL